MKDSIISVRGLTKSYKRGSEKIMALNEVSFDLPRGEFVAITGASGSGKTTLLNLLGCLDVPTAGSIVVNGKEVSKLPEKELVNIRRKNIGFVFQQFFLLPTLNVKENIALPLMFNRQNQSQEKLSRIIDIVGLKCRTEHLPSQLSGGEMQRVAIGRALINEPKIIFADEPTGNLDSATAQRIFELFHSLCREGISIIVVTHNPELASAAHGFIHLKDGKISEISDFLKADTCGAAKATVN